MKLTKFQKNIKPGDLVMYPDYTDYRVYKISTVWKVEDDREPSFTVMKNWIDAHCWHETIHRFELLDPSTPIPGKTKIYFPPS